MLEALIKPEIKKKKIGNGKNSGHVPPAFPASPVHNIDPIHKAKGHLQLEKNKQGWSKH